MQLNLPQQLSNEVIKYDATRARLARAIEQQNKPERKKARYPRGNVVALNLVPEEICKPDVVQKAIDDINLSCANRAYAVINRINADNELEAYLCIYYFKQLWVAFWVPETKDDYWYGMSFAFRDTKAGHDATSTGFFRNKSITLGSVNALFKTDDLKATKIGRTTWLHQSVKFNQDLINEGYTRNYWLDVDDCHHLRSYGSHYEMQKGVRQVETTLLKRIPRWSNSRSAYPSMWDRTQPEGNTIAYCLKQLPYNHVLSNAKLESYEHTVDWWLKTFKLYRYVTPLLDTAWFRKQLSKMCVNMQSALDNAGHNAELVDVTRYASELIQFCNHTDDILNIYPDINVDYLISRYDLITEVSMHTIGGHNTKAVTWIRNNLAVESFFNMMQQFHSSKSAERNDEFHRRYDMNDQSKRLTYYWRDWDDTRSMLQQVLEWNDGDGKDEQLEVKPKRWRITEWHDHLMAQTWKIRNPNIELPQKLFPKPVSVDNYTFIQPIDTHQLATWGQRVRNCVGSSGYADGIKKFKHLIVLCMIDRKPRITIQLKVDNAHVDVVQIADIGNERLSEDTKLIIQEKLASAFRKREEQLNN